MKRKVIQLAGKTHVISLPSKWVKQHGIKKGDELEVEQKKKQIIVSTKKQLELDKAKLILDGPAELIRRKLNTAYKKGYDELEIYFENPHIMQTIKQELQTLLGYEIIKQGEKHCIIKNIAGTLEQEFNNILRRIFIMLNEMGKDILDAINKQEFERLKEISTSEQTNDKLTNFCKRILNKKNDEQTNLQYCIVRELEKIADEHEAICYEITKNQQIDKKTIGLYQKANQLFRQFYEIFYKFQEKKAIQFTKNTHQLQKQIKQQIKKNKKDGLVLHNIMNLVTRTNEAVGPYYATIL